MIVGSKGVVGIAALNNLMIINMRIKRNKLKNPKVGQFFEVDNTENGVEMELELARKEEGGKRKSPVLKIDFQEKRHNEL